jgi:NADPH:quinone reductase-like Zn-dependent oxidoreductase
MPKIKVPGLDISGTIVAVGPKANKRGFKVGDEVVAMLHFSQSGALTEYTVVGEAYLARKPERWTHEQAAAWPLVATTVWQAVVVRGNVKKGDKVLINGASGGTGNTYGNIPILSPICAGRPKLSMRKNIFLIHIRNAWKILKTHFIPFVLLIIYSGTVGVQIAKALGAYVVGVCSTDNVELVKKLGADEVVDYKKENVTEKYTNQDFDLIFDTVGSAAEVNRSSLALLPFLYDSFVVR